MGKSAAARNRQRAAANRQSVKSAPLRAAAQRKAPPQSTSTSTTAAASSSSAVSLSSAVADAEVLLSRAQYAEAAALLHSALRSHPGAAQLHDLLALSNLGLGDAEAALPHLLTACQLDADGSGDRWMYLGQLRHGAEAIAAFERGVAIYQREKEALLQTTRAQPSDKEKDGEGKREGKGEGEGEGEDEDEDEDGDGGGGAVRRLAALRQSLSTAFVSMAELYVTDCCDEADAELRCNALLADAMSEWPDNAEGAYATANLRLIQGDDQQAAQWLDTALTIIERQYDPTRQPALSVLLASPLSSSSSGGVASYELRLNVAKLSYELGRYAQCAALIDGLLDEDDHFIEVQHLAACAHLQCARYSSAAQHATAALDMCRANGQHDKQAMTALRPVMAALRDVMAQCEGKEDENEDEDEDEAAAESGEEEDVEAEESDEDADAGQQADETMADELAGEQLVDDQSRHNPMTRDG